ncbi:metallophosphoesterase [Novosphingobium sp. TH158]|uniref:metallophosphoesterase n=1 Tax=Novosphingobium sp. TH158 TaxID=2067455 RepID=UPI000C7A64F1|nr:metallophosphoesterase [Novosphingobium sp. TH158]PLK25679.1 phosphohydrolase [Novosphingobium sp. TH158]
MRKALGWVRNNKMRAFRYLVLAVGIPCSIIAWRDTMADPVVRRTEVVLPGLAKDAPPLTIALLSDFHVADPDMPPSRLARIVAQVNALKPDYVMLAGDFITDRTLALHHYQYRDALAPLAALKPRIATIAVLGNHDHWRNAEEGIRELRHIGARVLLNESAQIGPLHIVGVGDHMSQHSDYPRAFAKAPADHGAIVALSHGPDVVPSLPDDIPLTLAGHTHCGQIQWPWGGSPAYMSNYGDRYACGRIVEGRKTVIVTAGLGTSVLPFRFLAVPDMWLVTVRGPK